MKLKVTSLILMITIGAAVSVNATPIGITDFGSVGKYSQNFNMLANSGTSSTLPTGWAFSETGSDANATYTAGNGGVGDTYSFGTGTSTDRALGVLRQDANPTANPPVNSFSSMFGVQFQNLTGGTITSLLIGYYGEQWSLGTLGQYDHLDFQYSTTATSLTDGTWNDVNILDFTTPNPGVVGAYNGNSIENRTMLMSTINALSIASGATFWLRWTDYNLTAGTGTDAGLAVDDFRLTANGVKPTSVPDSLPAGFAVGTLLLVLVLGHRFGRQMSKA